MSKELQQQPEPGEAGEVSGTAEQSVAPVSETAAGGAPAAEPVSLVEVDGVTYTLLGTAHVSRASADEVERLMATGDYDAVAIELDAGRFSNITNPDSWAKTDLFKVLREGKAGMLMANLALSAFQQRLADQVGIEPGQEMRVAISAARRARLPLLLIDRDIGITLRRVNASLPWFKRLTLMAGLATSVVSNEKISPEEVEALKEGDMLEAAFAEFAESSKELYVPLISERDRYMALRLEQETRSAVGPRFKSVLVVIGAGHLKGLEQSLRQGITGDLAAEQRELEGVKPATRWGKVIPWIIAALVIAGFIIGFSRSPELGSQVILDWVLYHGVLAGLGALVALAHPLTILTAIVVSPFTSLNPLIGAGFVAAGMELWLRKPQVADFTNLRSDVTTLRGWWRNRVSRTLLVFILTTLGSAAGTYIAGASIFVRLFR
jgi:pheromone shutdown-related protein TraB